MLWNRQVIAGDPKPDLFRSSKNPINIFYIYRLLCALNIDKVGEACAYQNKL